MDPRKQSTDDKFYDRLFPKLRARDPSLQALFDKYRRLWMYSGVKAVDVNQLIPTSGDTLLHYVASNSSVDEVNLLAAAGADINARGDMGQTPLHHAAIWGRTEVAARLLALGADSGLRDEFGQTALEAADRRGRKEMARLLKRVVKNHWPTVRAEAGE